MIFEKKIFLTQNFINWRNLVVWLPLLLKILGNMCIVTICCSFCKVIYCVIKVNFCIKPFFYITKKSGQNCKYFTSLNELALWSSGLANCFVCKRFAVPTTLWSLSFGIQRNLEHDTIAVWISQGQKELLRWSKMCFYHFQGFLNLTNCLRAKSFF